MIIRNSKNLLTIKQVQELVDNLMNKFKGICNDMPPNSSQKLLLFKLTKI